MRFLILNVVCTFLLLVAFKSHAGSKIVTIDENKYTYQVMSITANVELPKMRDDEECKRVAEKSGVRDVETFCEKQLTKDN